ncbi:MAG: hypothetical protein PHG95_00020 [Patescibacteria group bacterium]|nr:hypothetical protein [Patescibacteria group bacterium]
MRKKAEDRIEPFLEYDLTNDELEKAVKNLSPQNLGEIRQLVFLKIQEMKEEDQKILKKRLEQAECSEKIINEHLAFHETLIQKVRDRWEIFNNIFEERKQKKQQALKNAL